MPDVPVPETANAKEPSAAPKQRASRSRTSSSSRIISGSRWLSVGAAIARMTRGEVSDGPGPRRMRSVSGSSDMNIDLIDHFRFWNTVALRRNRRRYVAELAVAETGGHRRPEGFLYRQSEFPGRLLLRQIERDESIDFVVTVEPERGSQMRQVERPG